MNVAPPSVPRVSNRRRTPVNEARASAAASRGSPRTRATPRAAETITKVAHPDANIIFGAVIDDALGDEVRVTVIAAGFDKLGGNGRNGRNGGLAKVIESQPSKGTEREAVPSLLDDEDEDDIFKPAPASVSLSDEEDLDIPDFLKS